jgi:hypothetical protein
VPPIALAKDRTVAIWSVVRRVEQGAAASEIDTAGICIGAALANEDTAEGDVGRNLIACMALDLHALTLRSE